MQRTIKMLHSCFGTDWLFVGQGGITLRLPRVLVRVDVNGRLAKSAVNLNTHKGNLFNLVSTLVLLTPTFIVRGTSYSYPDGANMFKEFSHLLQVSLLRQSRDVDRAVLRVILLFRASYNKNIKCEHQVKKIFQKKMIQYMKE